MEPEIFPALSPRHSGGLPDVQNNPCSPPHHAPMHVILGVVDYARLSFCQDSYTNGYRVKILVRCAAQEQKPILSPALHVS